MSVNRPINIVCEGHEPLRFTMHFPDFNNMDSTADAFEIADKVVRRRFTEIQMAKHFCTDESRGKNY